MKFSTQICLRQTGYMQLKKWPRRGLIARETLVYVKLLGRIPVPSC